MALYMNLINEQLSQYSADYATGLSSHLPMNLYALHRLGASDEQIQGFYQNYIKRLRPRDPVTIDITAENFQSNLSQRKYNEELFQFFKKEQAQLSTEAFLEKYLAQFMPGVGTGAFHPLIRLAYGIEMGHAGEVAEAFAAWGLRYTPILEDFGEPTGSFAECREAVATIEVDKEDIAARSIFARAGNVITHASFRRDMRLPVDISIPQLADTALKIYLAKPTFAHLHLVTSCHALRVVDGVVPLPKEWLRYYWLAMWAVYVSEGSKGLTPPTAQSPAASWEQLAAEACTSLDDHTNKLVYSCMEEAKAYGGDDYLLAAGLKI